jgi:hypothetical protein
MTNAEWIFDTRLSFVISRRPKKKAAGETCG